MKIIIFIIFICYLIYVLLPLLKKIKYTATSVRSNSELGFGISYIKKVWYIFDTVHQGGSYLLLNIVLPIGFLIFYTTGIFDAPSYDKSYGSDYDESQIYKENIDFYDDEYSGEVGYGYIDSYVRSDGTEVSGHYRTDPDEYEENNFSYDGDENGDWDYEYHD
ncbi:hypothetical protein [Psychrobacter sp. NG27]|uniref:hypothetical protein n=1 Tax=Psychrobacter sp. NG27 TaxID=2781966 RepID=UPI0018DF78FF|nr:hypothetical protein [Psychrobacter sp. NG27]MBI0426472.1 hypothetical protein [Psychrobacter sp. NG27]